MFLEKIPKETLNELPLDYFKGEIILIENQDQMAFYLPEIAGNDLLGFDTESKPSFKKGQKNQVALIQLSTHEKAYLVRLAYLQDMSGLWEVFEDEGVVKVGAAVKDDLNDLKKIQKFEPGGFVDLQKYVEEFNIQDKGLKKLTGNVLGFRISKSQQLTNWESETLTEPQLNYAATDAWVCYEMYRKLSAIKNN